MLKIKTAYLKANPYEIGNAKFFCKASISQAFFSWVFTFKDKIKILTEDVRDEYKEYLNSVLNIYKN